MGKTKVKIQRTPFEVEHEDRRIHFVTPYFGPGNSKDVGLEIEGEGLRKPTLGEIVSLTHATLFGLVDEEIGRQVRYVLNHNMWGYTPTIFDRKVTETGGINLTKVGRRDLEGAFETELTDPEAMREHCYLVLLGDEEGAGKIAELMGAGKISNVGIGVPSEAEQPIMRPGSLALFSEGLAVNYSKGHELNGYAFGVVED